MVGPFSSSAVSAILGRLEDEAAAQLRQAGATDGLSVLRSVDMRYKGQIHEVSVPLAVDLIDPERIVRDFHTQYERRYGKGTTNPAAPVEALSWEVRAAAPATAPRVDELAESTTPAAAKSRRRVYFRGGWQQTPVYDRAALPVGASVPGPAIVDAPDTTVLVNPGQSVRMDGLGNLVMQV
jgi:N-methylhydantoinase A